MFFSLVYAFFVEVDIRELISLDVVEEELSYGPNGGLVYCIEYLAQNLEWLEEKIGDYGDDYLVVDMPGQVELYTHYKHVNHISQKLQNLGYNVCSVYLIDSRFLVDASTFISATLMAMACQINLELPHLNVLSKMDIVKRDGIIEKRDLESYLNPDTEFLLSKLVSGTNPKFRDLNESLCELISDYCLVRFHPISVKDAKLMNDFIMHVDNAIQYGEDVEPKEIVEEDDDDVNPIDDFLKSNTDKL